MRYALLGYKVEDNEEQEPISPDLAERLARPSVKGWLRLHVPSSATTVSARQGNQLVTDGPFVDSKEYLGGLIIIEAPNLDEALAFAAELQSLRCTGAVEVRPIIEEI